MRLTKVSALVVGCALASAAISVSAGAYMRAPALQLASKLTRHNQETIDLAGEFSTDSNGLQNIASKTSDFTVAYAEPATSSHPTASDAAVFLVAAKLSPTPTLVQPHNL